jgi:ABC-type transport system involved in multi-copper enzyme maturation permease subunit
MSSPLFGLLIIDREPYMFSDLLGLAQAWFQDAGGFIFPGLIIYILYALFANTGDRGRTRTNLPMVTLLGAAAAMLLYAVYYYLVLKGDGVDTLNRKVIDPNSYSKQVAPQFSKQWQPLILMIAGICSTFAACVPFALGVLKLRFRRIYAIAKLSVIEVIRNRVFLVLFIVFIPVLFPIKWFLPFKAEDELRVTVSVTFGILQVILMLTFALLASFTIPNDVKNQNIYTIITKPVEPFEILLGRFLGYIVLATAALLLLILGSLFLIESSNLSDAAKEETFKARVPVRGQLRFASRKGDIEGIDAGREFNYRKYIGGHPQSSQRAVYMYRKLPNSLRDAENKAVPVELTFDIYRMTKGNENRGVDVTIRVCTWNCDQVPPLPSATGIGDWTWKPTEEDSDPEQAYLREARRLLAEKLGGTLDDADYRDPISLMTRAMVDLQEKKPGDPVPKGWEVANELAAKFGFFEVATKEVYDMHPERVLVPSGLFQNAAAKKPKERKDENGKPLPPLPEISIFVKCTSAGQLLGMAEGDMYLLEGERSFAQNYFKASFGIWCRLVLVIGLALCISTYFAGTVTFLGTAVMYVIGLVSFFLLELGSGKSSVAGPFGSLNQLISGKLSTMPDEGTAIAKAASVGDEGFGFLIRRVTNFAPDVDAYNWTSFVSEGFNIPIEALVMNFVTLSAYLFPWFLLGFYLMRSREVAA